MLKPKIYKKRASFSLLEVVIGLSLTAILLTALFSSFRHLIYMDQKLYKTREIVHEHLVTRLRLKQLFETINSSCSFHTLSSSKDALQTLYFTLPPMFDSDPSFTTQLEYTLSLWHNHTVVLKRKNQKGQEKQEILSHWESAASLEFYDPITGGWVTSWDNGAPPPLFRLLLDETFLYIFLHPLLESAFS